MNHRRISEALRRFQFNNIGRMTVIMTCREMRKRPVKLLLLLGAFCGAVLSACCDEAQLGSAKRELYSGDHRRQTKALQAVGRCGELANDVVPYIASLMYDKNVGVASAAAYALRRIDSVPARKALEKAEKMRAHRRE